jgi:glycerophosphoryl diester phosphodiesterase
MRSRNFILVFSSLFVVAITASCITSNLIPEGNDLRGTGSVESIFNTQSGFDKQGHRGCRGLMPENTWAAMKTALDLGVTTLEMDVVITEDKKVVLSHEAFFNHEITTKPDGSPVTEIEEKTLKIYHMPYSQVKTYDVGMKPHPRFPAQKKLKAYKPLLSDIMDSVKEYMKTSRRPFPLYNIETKTSPSGDKLFHPKPDEFVELLMAVIKQKGLESSVTIQSFDYRTLKYLHEKYPAIQTAMLQDEFSITLRMDYIKLLGFTPTIYSPAYKSVTDSMINACHQQNMRIIPWTVNDKKEIERLRKMGVDGIITDFPNLFE